MVTISLCMIVKNEEDVLARCLDSVKDIANEIIIVDTGSTDKTKEIARNYTDKIFDFQWIDDFSAARNFSFSKATKDYILWLDADDIILKDDRDKFKQLKQNLAPTVDTVMMKYNVGFDEYESVTLSYFRERLTKRLNKCKWIEPVHEYLEIKGNIINSDICITHKKEHPSTQKRNLAIYEKKLSNDGTLSPRSLYYYAKELYENRRYDNAIEYFNKFLDTEKGWIEDNISACLLLSSCYEAKNDEKNILIYLLKSFEYDTPRAESCCKIGNYYLDSKDYKRAIFWYKLATQIEEPTDNWGFMLHDYFDYIPNMQLCLCYDRLRNIKEAIKYNNKAAECKPNDPAVLYNKKYFENIDSNYY